jgi:NitT/TauT family transport system permease protein
VIRRLRNFSGVLPSIAVAVLLISGWQLYVSLSHVSPFLLPSPGQVWRALVRLLGESSTLHATLVTVWEIAGGFLIALAAGVPIGLVLALTPPVERALNPFVVALQVMPKVVLIPLFSLWFGFGVGSKLAVSAIFAFLPILTTMVAGVRSTDPHHRDLFLSLGASRRQRVLLLDLPSALPWVLTGMQVGIVLATVGAVVAEFLGGTEGLGYLTVSALNQLEVATMFALIILLSVVGYVLYVAVALLRRLVVPWHHSVAGWTQRPVA